MTNKFENERYFDEGPFSDRIAPWMKEAFKMLNDGEWRKRDEIIAACAQIIPPGVAYRKTENARIGQRKREARNALNPDEYEEWLANPENLARKPWSAKGQTFLIQSGRRLIMIDHLNSSKRIEKRKDEDGTVWVRRIPINDVYLNSGPNRMRNGQWRTEKRSEQSDGQ